MGIHRREQTLAHSPVEQAHRILAPLQPIWGRQGPRAPIAHDQRLRSAWKEVGREPEWVGCEGKAPGWRQLWNRVDMTLKIEALLARRLPPHPDQSSASSQAPAGGGASQ